jgi:hypothetical protein
LPSCASRKASTRTCTTADQRRFWRPARSAWRATPRVKPIATRSGNSAERALVWHSQRAFHIPASCATVMVVVIAPFVNDTSGIAEIPEAMFIQTVVAGRAGNQNRPVLPEGARTYPRRPSSDMMYMFGPLAMHRLPLCGSGYPDPCFDTGCPMPPPAIPLLHPGLLSRHGCGRTPQQTVQH